MKRILIIFVFSVIFATPVFACTTAIVGAKASKTGRPLIWKQRDGSFTKNAIVHNEDGLYSYTALVAANDKDQKGAYAGVNEKGFAIINNASFHILEKGCKAANGVVMKKALQTCQTIDDFETLLQNTKEPRNVASNFGVMDSSGAAAYFEVGSWTVKRYDVPEDGWLVRTNFSFSGSEENGSGLARYESAEYIMKCHEGKFGPDDLISSLGRSFRNEILGGDLLARGGYAWDEDFIPRPSTTGSVCIEGMIPGDDPSSVVMWCAPGYTPACYSIPVWEAAGIEIASPVASLGNGNSPMNEKGEELRLRSHDAPRDAAQKYINLDKIREIISLTQKAEAIEMKEGRALVEKFRKEGFSLEAVKAYNQEAARRFEEWKKI